MRTQSCADPNNLGLKELIERKHFTSDFLSYYSLAEAKELLWSWLESTVTGNFPKDVSRRDRSTILDFYRRLESFLESSYQDYDLVEKKTN